MFEHVSIKDSGYKYTKT